MRWLLPDLLVISSPHWLRLVGAFLRLCSDAALPCRATQSHSKRLYHAFGYARCRQPYNEPYTAILSRLRQMHYLTWLRFQALTLSIPAGNCISSQPPCILKT